MGSHLRPKWLEFFLGNIACTEFISLVYVAAITVKEILRIYEEIDIPLKCAMYYLKIVCLIYILHVIHSSVIYVLVLSGFGEIRAAELLCIISILFTLLSCVTLSA